MNKHPKTWKSWKGRPNYREKMFNRNVLKSVNNLFSSCCHGNYLIKCLKKNSYRNKVLQFALQNVSWISSNHVYFGASKQFCKRKEFFFSFKITIVHCNKGMSWKVSCFIFPHANHGKMGKKTQRVNLHFFLWNAKSSCLLLLSQMLFELTFWWYLY